MEQINKNTLVSVHDEEITLLESFDKFIEVLNLSEEVNSVKDKETALEQFVTDAYGRLNNKILTNANEIERVDEKTKDLENDIINVKQLIKPVYAYSAQVTFASKIEMNNETKQTGMTISFYSTTEKENGDDINLATLREMIGVTRVASAVVGLANVNLLTIPDSYDKVQFSYFNTAQNKHIMITKNDITRVRITAKGAI